jgi:NAD(P)-dependent dehydrogenase (short-subunit alcohol dehydrogenase family)
MRQVDGKIALVTGGASGIGAALLVSRAQGVFDEAGTLTDAAMKDRLREFLHDFVDFSHSHSHLR